MENQKNEISQIKNLLGEVNNHIIQINDRIIQINKIITQINNIMINNNKSFNQNNIENQKIDNFIQMMNNFKINMNEVDLISGKDKEQKLLYEEGFLKEYIETVMYEGRCSREVAINALKMHNGDPVEALLDVGLNNDEKDEKKINSIKKDEEFNEENLDKEAIETVIKDGRCTREIAIKALIKHKGDPVEALLEVGQ